MTITDAMLLEAPLGERAYTAWTTYLVVSRVFRRHGNAPSADDWCVEVEYFCQVGDLWEAFRRHVPIEVVAGSSTAAPEDRVARLEHLLLLTVRAVRGCAAMQQSFPSNLVVQMDSILAEMGHQP